MPGYRCLRQSAVIAGGCLFSQAFKIFFTCHQGLNHRVNLKFFLVGKKKKRGGAICIGRRETKFFCGIEKCRHLKEFFL